MLAQSGKELSSSACTALVFPFEGIWVTGVNVKKQRPPCPSASCWEKGGFSVQCFYFKQRSRKQTFLELLEEQARCCVAAFCATFV